MKDPHFIVTADEPDFPHSIHDTLEEAAAHAIKDGAWYGGSAGVEIKMLVTVKVIPCFDYVNPNFPQERFSVEKGMMVPPST